MITFQLLLFYLLRSRVCQVLVICWILWPFVHWDRFLSLLPLQWIDSSMSSAFILPQTKLYKWSKALVMVFTLASITVLPWSQRGEYGFGTPKPSCHWQLLATGNSDRQGGGPLHLASPPCPPCESFQRHPQMPPTWEISSLTCQALLATVSTTGLRARIILYSTWR